MKSVELLGVYLHNLSDAELEVQLDAWLKEQGSYQMVTPNPEMLLLARQDPAFRAALNAADLSLPDGVGLKLASILLRGKNLTRHTGVETLERLARLSSKQHRSILLIGGELPNVADKAASLLAGRYPGSRIQGFDPGKISDPNKIDASVLEHIRSFNPAILAVALGQGRQERFIATYLPELPSVRIAIGVGGAFDMLSGAIPRAPKLLRRFGLEWAWRLLQEPSRLPRILRATVVFPITIVYDTLKKR